MSSDKRKENLTAWERWELASFDPQPLTPPSEKGSPNESALKLSTAEEIEQLRQQALEAGHAAGYAAGYAAGQAHARAEGALFAELVQQFDAAFSEYDQQIAEQLLSLALEIARQVIRKSIEIKPESLLEVIREALAQMPHPHSTIHLHPDDASMVRSYFGEQLAHAGHRIHEDKRLDRGGCLIEAGSSQIDAGISTRWRRIVETLGSHAEWLVEDPAK